MTFLHNAPVFLSVLLLFMRAYTRSSLSVHPKGQSPQQ